jgi:hypothetical protein
MCDINDLSLIISSTNMSVSTTNAGDTTTTTKEIVGLAGTPGKIVGMIETMKDMSAMPRKSQESKMTWTGTGTVPSSNIAGIQERAD